MVYCSSVMSFGLIVFLYGIMEDFKWFIAIGIIFYLIGMICGDIVEDRLNNKITKLEKDIKELKET